MRNMVLTTLCLVACGCGGGYTMTAPDQVAPAGGQAAVVVRLTRDEVRRVDVPVKKAGLEFRLGGEVVKAAFTDEDGFAEVAIAAPDAPGRYEVCVHHQDPEGDECRGEALLYTWAPDRPAVAVELDELPGPSEPEVEAAVTALRGISEDANIVYLTQEDIADHADVRAWRDEAGYPDGPVLPWAKRRWRMTREGRLKLPRLRFDPRMIGPLAGLREVLPGLDAGVCLSEAAAKAFDGAGLAVFVVGDEDDLPEGARRTSWAELSGGL